MIKLKKTINSEVDCAVCAQKVEDAIKKIDGVQSCNINFITQKMTIEAEDVDSLLKQIKKAARKIEPDFEIE